MTTPPPPSNIDPESQTSTSEAHPLINSKLPQVQSPPPLLLPKPHPLLKPFLTLGIVFGDIGTSPLYVFSSIFSAGPPPPDQVIGALSLCIYTIFIIVIVKYLIFVLLADDVGEGGIFAIYNLCSKGLSTILSSSPHAAQIDTALATLALVGLSALCSEGILTPSISVLSAIEGLSVVSPVLQPIVVPLTVVILIAFFSVQHMGTRRISFLFSPVISVWFLCLFAIGVYNTLAEPSVLLAFNPARSLEFISRHGGLEAMGSVFLTVTGAEALYGDLGHFSASAIRTSAVFLVIPSLLACYCGQAAVLTSNPAAYSNVFFLSLPSRLLTPMVLLSALAAIIASQAMISASFSLISQAIARDCFPRLTVVRTHETEIGQVYIPQLNALYCVCCVLIVLGFRSAQSLGDAYGVAVSTLFCITTLFYSLAILVHFKRHIGWAVAFCVCFGFIDTWFLAANVLKIADGGWFTLTLGTVLCVMSLTWRWGRLEMRRRQGALARDNASFLAPHPVSPHVLVCLTSSNHTIPPVFVHFFQRLHIRPRVLVLLTLVVFTDKAHGEALEVRVLAEGVWKATHMRGFMDEQPDLRRILARVVGDDDIGLDGATFLLGRSLIECVESGSWAHRLRVGLFAWLLANVSASARPKNVPSAMELIVEVAI